MTIQEKAQELYKGIDWKEINGDQGNKIVVITAEFKSAVYNDLSTLTLLVSEETSLSNDSVYRFVMESLGSIADSEGSKEEIQDIGHQIEADYMTSDLTEWLNESNYHVEYLSQALSEFSPKDGFDALRIAQYLAKEEVFYIVLDWLDEQVNTK